MKESIEYLLCNYAHRIARGTTIDDMLQRAGVRADSTYDECKLYEYLTATYNTYVDEYNSKYGGELSSIAVWHAEAGVCPVCGEYSGSMVFDAAVGPRIEVIGCDHSKIGREAVQRALRSSSIDWSAA